MDNDIKTYEKDSELRDSFKEFQNQTNARFYNIEHSFYQITESISTLHKSVAGLSSCQNKFHQDDERNSDISFVEKADDDTTFDDHYELTNPYSCVQTTTPMTKGISDNNDSVYNTPTTTISPVCPVLHKFWKVVRDAEEA